MKPVKINGFTIVETMLFLGISGLLILGVLVGTGSSINIQRYHDSVTSLQSQIQQQFSNVANVNNDGTINTCNGAPIIRGQSDCVILGKYISINGTTNNLLHVKDVYGMCPPSLPSDDVDALIKCNIYAISNADTDTYTIDWGSNAVKTDGSNMVLSMLILRSPSSGTIRTFISSSSLVVGTSQISTILSEHPSALLNSAKICVNSNGLFTGTKMAVQIDSNTTSASGVELLGDNSGCN